MMAWLIFVPDKIYFKFYITLEKHGKINNVVCANRVMSNRKYICTFVGKFEIPFAEYLEKELGITCIIFGPAELWRRALSYNDR